MFLMPAINQRVLPARVSSLYVRKLADYEAAPVEAPASREACHTISHLRARSFGSGGSASEYEDVSLLHK